MAWHFGARPEYEPDPDDHPGDCRCPGCDPDYHLELREEVMNE
jgi:hypothetical protein